MIPLLNDNAARNNVTATTAALDWNAPPYTPLEGRVFAAVLIADPVYSSPQIPGLLAVLREVLSINPACRIFLAHKHRHEDVDSALLASIQALGCQLHLAAASSVDPRVKVYDSRARLQNLSGTANANALPDLWSCVGQCNH